MLDYKVAFEQVPLKSEWTKIQINHEGRIATVFFCSTFDRRNLVLGTFNPEIHGKHEAIHLLLSRLASLAASRYLMPRELEDAEEGIVRVLEKVLK